MPPRARGKDVCWIDRRRERLRCHALIVVELCDRFQVKLYAPSDSNLLWCGITVAERPASAPAEGRLLHAEVCVGNSPWLKTCKAGPDCPPGSSGGSPDQAPTPAAGSTDGRHRSGAAASRPSASARAA
jgi:hypothetical protein